MRNFQSYLLEAFSYDLQECFKPKKDNLLECGHKKIFSDIKENILLWVTTVCVRRKGKFECVHLDRWNVVIDSNAKLTLITLQFYHRKYVLYNLTVCFVRFCIR